MTKFKKWSIVASAALNVVLIITVVVIWPEKKAPLDLSKYTQDDLSKALLVETGMSRAEVKRIMGIPAIRDIELEIEEWHYCKTGSSIDEYVAIAFKSDKVVKVSNYTVSWLDMMFHYTKAPTKEIVEIGGLGDCKVTARWGSYNQKTPSYPANPSANYLSDNPSPAVVKLK